MLLPPYSDAQAQDEREQEFVRTTYIAGGFGVSNLNPETEGTRWDVTQSSSTGLQLALGMDFSKRLTGELHFTTLGEAGLQERANTTVEDSISYQIVGASVLAYLTSYDDHLAFIKRAGLAAYVRGGIGFLSNSSDTIIFEQSNSMHFLLGLGAEYALDNGLGLRAELIAFDGDARYAQLGVLYRFGKSSDSTIEQPKPVPEPVVAPKVIAREPAVVPKPAPEPKPAPKPAPRPVVSNDDDADGVTNNLDKCPGSIPGKPIGVDGCEIFNGVLEGVNFETGSAQLTAGAKRILKKAANELIKFQNVRIQISAHTDDRGDDGYNLDLSRQRVVAVANFLTQNGVAKSRFTGRAYGETRPMVSNATEQGRARNRRVEITQIK